MSREIEKNIKTMPLQKAENLPKECWICGGKGNSREHLLKSSDVKLYFGKISPKKPVYVNRKGHRNVKIKSRKSDYIKAKSLICKNCNSSTTQPYDKAWEEVSSYLKKNSLYIRKNKEFDFKKIFPGNSKVKCQHLQLYFIKLTGCLLADAVGYTTLAKDLGKSILDCMPREDVFLSFCVNKIDLPPSISDLHVLSDINKSFTLCWEYTIGYISVVISFCHIPAPNKLRKSLGWIPKIKSKIIKLRENT